MPDPAAFVATLAKLVAPGGMLVMSTLSRTWRAWLLGVVGAEFCCAGCRGARMTGSAS